MIVPDEIRKCVAYVGYKDTEGKYYYAGSVFIIGRPIDGGLVDPVYWVTARHVIDGIRSLGLLEVCVRVNKKDGSSEWITTSLSDWYWSEKNRSIDVAIFCQGVHAELDHLVIPYSLFATDVVFKENEISLGDEVFVTGLFRHHHGQHRNIPIVRIGNLASMLEREIVTKNFGGIEGYLIEARSIGGLSGSPVFLNLGSFRVIQGNFKFTGEVSFFLLGLVHGHFDTTSTSLDNVMAVVEDSDVNKKINTGIAIVVPISSIMKTITEFENRPPPPLAYSVGVSTTNSGVIRLDDLRIEGIGDH